MSERLPYEDQLQQQWNDLPLPDENMAWEDMKRRLDEDDDDNPLLPFWLRGCAGWALLGVVVMLLGWWAFRPEKWFMKKQDTASVKKTGEQKIDPKNDTSVYTAGSEKIAPDTNTLVADSNEQKNNVPQGDSISIKNKPTKKIITGGGDVTIRKENESGNKKRKKQGNKKEKDKIVVSYKPGIISPVKKKDNGEQTDSATTINPPKIIMTDSVKTNIITTVVKIDSVHLVKTDSTKQEIKKEEVSKTKKDSTKKTPLSFSAGIALHQQIPIAGQGLTPYNELGRKGSLRDYIPSVYIRLNKENKWFIQTGFRYGAPQLENGQLYSAKTDTISLQKYNTTSAYLKKTFYHQVPLTFNYHITPALSIGTGVVWNKFSGAVSSRDVVQFDRQTGSDTALSSNVIFNSRSTDSNFVKSYFQLSFEAQYKWKRFSFGTNYSVGLQPYIKFILPGGLPQQAKNKALQLFIRYELWRPKKK